MTTTLPTARAPAERQIPDKAVTRNAGENDNRLGNYLKDRRSRLDPAALGFSLKRRRTAGLRREEVAQRANISATWYTWLEQGRGGAPSAEVLKRISLALMLTEAEHEHLFLLALGRPPEVQYQAGGDVTPRLQRVLDLLEFSPALIKNATWDVLAWNRAATLVLNDYSALPPDQRNILRMIFCDTRVRAAQYDWEGVARFVVSVFRADVARAGAGERIAALVEELSQCSPEFAAIWRETDVRSYGGGVKKIRHPIAGLVAFEYSTFAVDGRPDLGMVIYNPATPQDLERIRSMMKASAKPAARTPRRTR